MTRETKIGLLVGLAFIIVIGILISDHVSSTNDSTSGPLQTAGNTMRNGLGEPPLDEETPMVRSPRPITPRERLATREDFTPRRTNPAPSRSLDSENPDSARSNAGSSNDRTDTGPVFSQDTNSRPSFSGNRTGGQAQTNTEIERLRSLALAKGEPLVPADNDSRMPLEPNNPVVDVPGEIPHPIQLNNINTAENSTTADSSDKNTLARNQGGQPGNSKPARAPVMGYKAQSGDTLGSIAARAYGSNNRANRDLITQANPVLKANSNLIVAGKTYVIPQLSSAKPEAVVNTGGPVRISDTVPENADSTPSPAPVKTPDVETYVVQPGDSLWSIAKSEVGSASAVARIRELNADVLNGSDKVCPDMKLRLPKAASSN